MESRRVELIETESSSNRLVVFTGWRVGEIGRYWSNGTNFQLKMLISPMCRGVYPLLNGDSEFGTWAQA